MVCRNALVRFCMHSHSLCNPMDCSPPDFSVPGILQAKILDLVFLPSSRGSSCLRDWTCVFCIPGTVQSHQGSPEMPLVGFLGSSAGKESACSAGHLGSIPGLGRSPRRRHGNRHQHFCLPNPHGQRSLASYSPWGGKESDDWATKHSTHAKSIPFQLFLLMSSVFQIET